MDVSLIVFVIPAEAGIQNTAKCAALLVISTSWIPAFAGMTI